MIYPPQTSLIPVTVALTKFIETHGFTSFYPFWYLGVPLKYLTGPIIPSLLIGMHKVIPTLTLFDLTYVLLFLSFVLGAVGWGILAKILSGSKKIGFLAGLLFLILPWKWLSTLALAEASQVIAENMLPWVLILLNNYFTQKDRKRLLLSILSITFILLINTTITPTIITGAIALSLPLFLKRNKKDDDSWDEFLGYGKRLLLIFSTAFVLATFWYTPGFWWTILANPSLGGESGFKVILNLIGSLRNFLPLVVAIAAVYFSGQIRGRLESFTLIWVGNFLVLTIFRLLSNVDFWQDWSSWFFELEIGLGLFLALRLKQNPLNITKRLLLTCLLFALPFVVTLFIYQKLGLPPLISDSLPEGIVGLANLNQIVGDSGKTVFLSGSTVFWADSLYDLKQVRGGRDEVATNPIWQKAAYEIREGSDPQTTQDLLIKLGVSYVLVHGPDSPEYYHDFKNLDKWDRVGKKTWSGNGDSIYDLGLAQ